MLARLLRMVFCALIIVTATAIIIEISDTNTNKDFTELTYSNTNILRLLEEVKEKKLTVVDFSADKCSLMPP
jgi:hypothetical protein